MAVGIRESVPLSQRTSEGIARILRSEIFSGQLRAGEALPERTLAERLQVSRTPVREALFILQSEGLVDLVPNRGASVRIITSEDLLEIYTIRGLLEAHAARLAAEQHEPEQIYAMEDAQTQLRRMRDRGSGSEQASADLAFHVALSGAAGSPMLKTLLGQVLAFTASYRANYEFPTERSQSALVEHEAILEAVRDSDGELAERLMREHVESSCRFALQQFDKRGARDETG